MNKQARVEKIKDTKTETKRDRNRWKKRRDGETERVKIIRDRERWRYKEIKEYEAKRQWDRQWDHETEKEE